MADTKITLGQGARSWVGRKEAIVYEHKSARWGLSRDASDSRLSTICIRGVNYGHILEMTKEDARELCFILFDLTEDPKDEAKPAED